MLSVRQPSKIVAQQTDVIAVVEHLKRLPVVDWETASAGREIYLRLCSYCHGAYGRGDGILSQKLSKLPRNLRDLSTNMNLTDDQLRQTIAKGKGAMPGAQDVLSSDEIQWIIAYLRVLSPGFEIYDRFCTRCHGVDGYPPIEGDDLSDALRQTINVYFDEDYFKTRTEEQIRLKVRHMYLGSHSTMPHFGFSGDITNRDAEEILRFLRRLTAGDPR
jgi:mono/diheme cytochrome c family protein